MLGSARTSDTAFGGPLKRTNTPEQNSAIIQTALDTMKDVCIDQRGSFPVAPGMRARSWGQILFGQGPYQTTLDCRGAGDFFHNNGQHGFSVRDLGFTGVNGVTGGSAIVFDGTDTTIAGTGQIIGGDLQNIRMLAMWNGVWVRDINTLTSEDVEMIAMNGNFGVGVAGMDANQRTDLVRLSMTKYSPAPSAVAAGRGIALYVDGYVQTVDLANFIAVRPLRGIQFANSPGFGMGMRPAFLTASNIQIDFPYAEALYIDACDRVKILGGYAHGSITSSNIVLNAGVRDTKLVAINSTGAHFHAITSDGESTDIIGMQTDWSSQAGLNVANGIMFGANAQRGRVIGGGGIDTLAAWGICRLNNATDILLSAADHHYGNQGLRNF